MTQINTTAAAARENARHDTGRFGEQEHTAPEMSLTSITDNYGGVENLEEALALGDMDADSIHAMLEGITPGSADEIIAENYGGLAELDEAIAMGDVDADGVQAMLQRAAKHPPAPSPFVFDRDYKNHEQVRPYMDEFLRVFDEVKRPGTDMAYDDAFYGRLSSLGEVSQADEKTAVYMLQNLRRLDQEAVVRQQFLESGGRKVTAEDLEPGQVLRGTAVKSGFYMGGTGWEVHEDVRLRVRQYPNGRRELEYVQKGKRNGQALGDGDIYFRED